MQVAENKISQASQVSKQISSKHNILSYHQQAGNPLQLLSKNNSGVRYNPIAYLARQCKKHQKPGNTTLATPVSTGSVSNDTIQRKVGFEFQTKWEIVNANLPFAMTALTKNVALAEGPGWKLTRDDGEAEFVTKEVEEGDFAALTETFIDLRKYTQRLQDRNAEPNISTKSMGNSTLLGWTTNIVPKGPNLLANPQMTAGVDLTKITEIMRQLGNTSDPNHQQFIGGRETLMNDLSDMVMGNTSEEYQGLVKLMASYVYISHSIAGYADTPKNISSLMSRTNFAEVYALCPEARAATSVNQKAQHLLQAVIDAASLVNEPNRRYVPISEDMRMIPADPAKLQKAADADLAAQTLRSGPTLSEWVNGIVLKGKDLLSGFTNVQNVSMGSLGTERVAGNSKDGVILEFRDLKKQIPQEQWGDFAYALLYWVTLMNSQAPSGGTFPDQGTRVSDMHT